MSYPLSNLVSYCKFVSGENLGVGSRCSWESSVSESSVSESPLFSDMALTSGCIEYTFSDSAVLLVELGNFFKIAWGLKGQIPVDLKPATQFSIDIPLLHALAKSFETWNFVITRPGLENRKSRQASDQYVFSGPKQLMSRG